MNTSRRTVGFALLEILAATILLAGLIYLFMAFNKNKTHQMHNVTVGMHLSALVNDILLAITTPSNVCYHLSQSTLITQCVALSPNFTSQLIEDGFQINQSTVISTISTYCPIGTSCTSGIPMIGIHIVLQGPVLAVDAQSYMPQVFNSLTPDSLQYFNAELPQSFLYLVRNPNSSSDSDTMPADSGELLIMINIESKQ